MDVKEADRLIGAYRYVFNSPEGQKVLEDLMIWSGMIPDPEKVKVMKLTHFAGDDLTHSQCAYRNGTQDVVKYIEAMSSMKED